MDYQNRLSKILLKPGNLICADCNSKNPRWASISLGVFVCIRCCGVHRSLGTHISKMKSTTLDKWSSEMIYIFDSIDNKIANAYWEASFHSSNKPVESSSTQTVENFIRNKYQHKNWIGNGPDPVTLACSPKTLEKQQILPQNNQKNSLFSTDLIGSEILKAPSSLNFQSIGEIDIFQDDSGKGQNLVNTSQIPVRKTSGNNSLFESLQTASVIQKKMPNPHERTIEENYEINADKNKKITQVLSMYGTQPSGTSVKSNLGFQPLGAIAAQNFFNQVHHPNKSYPNF